MNFTHVILKPSGEAALKSSAKRVFALNNYTFWWFFLKMLRRINTFQSVTTGGKHWIFVYKQHTPELHTANPAKFNYYVTLEKINISNNHRIYLINSNTEASTTWDDAVGKTQLHVSLVRRELSHSKVPEQAYTVLKLCINDRWSPAEELPLLLLLSREVQRGEAQLQASSFPPCPTYPRLGWEPPARPGFAELAPGPKARLQLPTESGCSLQGHSAKAISARGRKALKDSPFSQENLQ